ncbi:DNA polymerase III subunit delta' [Sporosarcina pasteurii]|uniref:DNA polymerase III subunit delta' n=1 Tax=Sporosarcina pasteurii TaxID=1474 RepID=A0A380BAK0_SPOPA|nr:DNA polymerase III subunit delta' [Sporosarcina pasteurii]MDS9473312.1 DNA polymerase III subunit delta' [Sporosarcina pasteurii]QBQ06541.1 DNA polymerase III subunit delta' [Sporosarcina pasteurii]SUI98068.1 DNA polymerase III subunit tau [Sporosarcina pasteurii]
MESTTFINQQIVMSRLKASFEHNRIGHAYIFDGERGTGKEEISLFFAKLLLCQNPTQNAPCETCSSCLRVASRNHPNITIIYPDGQTIKKGQMDEFLLEMTKKGYESGRKIYIISQAERMNSASANALLKYLEEPEGNVTAILLTESYQAILPTIQSRCQRISFLPPSRETLISMLEEQGITRSMAATVTMLTANIEEALQLAQEDEFAHMRKTVLKLVEASDQNIHEALLYIQSTWSQVFKEREETDRGLDLLLYAYRDVVALKAELNSMSVYPDYNEFLNSLAMKLTYSQLSAVMEAILQSKRQLGGNMNRTLLMEQLMLNMQEGFLVV